MAGTKAGAARAKENEIQRYMDSGMTRKRAEREYTEVRKRAGSFGGKMSPGALRPFAANRELARIAGRKGGAISRRGKKNEN